MLFRSASVADFDFCARLYFAGREEAIRAEGLDRAALVADLRRRWDTAEVRILALDGVDIGWIQCAAREDALFIVQLFIDAPFQGRGLGTEVMRRILDEGRARGCAVTLGVVKTNPAQRLSTRLGFRITHEDERKFFMRRDLDGAPSTPDRV